MKAQKTKERQRNMRIPAYIGLWVAILLATGQTAALAKDKDDADKPANENAAAMRQHSGEHHPHGIVTAVSGDSITIEKGKKHKTKTFKISPSVTVEKKHHGRKHSGDKAVTTGLRYDKRGGKHDEKGQLAEVKVGDHVRLALSGKEVTHILDKGAKHHRHGRHDKTSGGLTQKT